MSRRRTGRVSPSRIRESGDDPPVGDGSGAELGPVGLGDGAGGDAADVEVDGATVLSAAASGVTAGLLAVSVGDAGAVDATVHV